MSKLTMRSKIQVRWSTDPRDVGYSAGRGPSDWMAKKSEIMSVRKAAYFRDHLDQKVGQGVYKAISYQHNGEDVTRDELETVISCAEYAAEQRKRGY
jgi:hypothetical protein